MEIVNSEMDAGKITKILDEIPAEIAWKRPDSIVKSSTGWFQVITPSSPLIPLNGIYRSVLNAKEVDSIIEDAIATYNKNKSAFRWIITGASRPLELADRLTRWNFRKDHEAIGFAKLTTELSSQETDTSIVVQDLVDSHLEEWVDASVSGWGNPESFRESLLNDVRRALHEERRTLRYFSAFIDRKIIGTGTIRLCNQSGHLIGSSVRPEFRGRGVYRALVLKRAQIALSLNLPLLTTHGIQNTSAPILKKMGFGSYSSATQFSHSSES